MNYCTTLEELQKYQGNYLRTYSRKCVLDLLSTISAKSNSKDFKRPRVHFLYIHHIFDDEVDTFRLLLKELAEQHTFISQSDAISLIKQGKVDKPYISWSSDDGFKNNLTAAKLLEEVGARACFYVNPYSIQLKGYAQIQDFCKNRLEIPTVQFLSWSDVETLLKNGHEIGAHTFKHDRVSSLTLNEFKDDFDKTDAVLRKYCGPIEHFAYTYGKFEDCYLKAIEYAYEKGYESCASAVRGCHTNSPLKNTKGPLLLRRDQIVAGWPLGHSLYFVAQSAKNMKENNHYPPIEWHAEK